MAIETSHDRLAATENAAPSIAALELFFGDASDAEARVYARLPSTAPLDGWEITGTLTGPTCRFAKTLPASIQFRNCGPGSGLLAEAVVPDPCFWTPELPFLYRATIELRQVAGAGGAAEAPEGRAPGLPFGPAPATQTFNTFTVERWFGIRRLGVIGRSLHLDAERWVARGICREAPTTSDLIAAREAISVLRVVPPADDFCLEASRLGVPLFVDLDGDKNHIAMEVRRLGQWPAVFAIVLDPAAPIDNEIRAAAHNTLFAVPLLSRVPVQPGKAKHCQPTAPPQWAQIAICNAEPAEAFSTSVGDCEIPIIAVRQDSANTSISAARAACDRLQFDLAQAGQFAGYLV